VDDATARAPSPGEVDATGREGRRVSARREGGSLATGVAGDTTRGRGGDKWRWRPADVLMGRCGPSMIYDHVVVPMCAWAYGPCNIYRSGRAASIDRGRRLGPENLYIFRKIVCL
jgi:hypothetical protein